MSTLVSRVVGAVAATATAGTLMIAAPVSAAPVGAATAASGAVRTAVAPSAGERNPKVSRSLTGVRPSAYIGKYYRTRSEGTRRCIVRRESGGNYRIASASGRYRGAYQFNSSLARATAKRMGRSDLARRPMNVRPRIIVAPVPKPNISVHITAIPGINHNPAALIAHIRATKPAIAR